jgi:hypothetical protein
MENFFHAIQHTIHHFWCCYFPTIKSMIIPGMGIMGTLGVCRKQIVNFLKRIK